MKKLISPFLLLIAFTLFATGCEIIANDEPVDPNIYVQLNNFSHTNVLFWTTDRATQTLVSPNEQYSAQQPKVLSLKPRAEYQKTIYLQNEGSSNTIDAQASYIIKAQNSADITIIFTWDGTNLTLE